MAGRRDPTVAVRGDPRVPDGSGRTSPPVAKAKIVEVWRSDREVIDVPVCVGRAGSTRCVVE